MDNPRIIVVNEKRPAFELAMRLAFKDASATCWFEWTPPKENRYENVRAEELLGVTGTKFLVFSWEPAVSYGGEKRRADHIPLPFKMGADAAIGWAWEWLQQQDYGEQPDHDGSNGKGFIVFNESWGHVGNDHYAICAVGPAWAMYGK